MSLRPLVLALELEAVLARTPIETAAHCSTLALVVSAFELFATATRDPLLGLYAQIKIAELICTHTMEFDRALRIVGRCIAHCGYREDLRSHKMRCVVLQITLLYRSGQPKAAMSILLSHWQFAPQHWQTVLRLLRFQIEPCLGHAEQLLSLSNRLTHVLEAQLICLTGTAKSSEPASAVFSDRRLDVYDYLYLSYDLLSDLRAGQGQHAQQKLALLQQSLDAHKDPLLQICHVVNPMTTLEVSWGRVSELFALVYLLSAATYLPDTSSRRTGRYLEAGLELICSDSIRAELEDLQIAFLILHGHLEAASQNLERVSSIRGKTARTFLLEGGILQAKGQLEAALQAYSTQLQFDGLYTDEHSALAMLNSVAILRLSDSQKAHDVLRRAEELYFDQAVPRTICYILQAMSPGAASTSVRRLLHESAQRINVHGNAQLRAIAFAALSRRSLGDSLDKRVEFASVAYRSSGQGDTGGLLWALDSAAFNASAYYTLGQTDHAASYKSVAQNLQHALVNERAAVASLLYHQ